MPGGDAIGMGLSYSMLRKWGFGAPQVAVATGATAVWNVIANVGFAVVAVVLLALGGQSNPLLTTAALIGGIALVVGLVAFVVALRSESYARRVGALAERLANKLLPVIRRPRVANWDERLALFREEAIGLIRRRWHVLTLATLAGHLTVFLVLVVAIRAVGIPASHVTFTEAFAAWSLIRILTTIPITPGGLGIVGRPHRRAGLVRGEPGRGRRGRAALSRPDVHPADEFSRSVPADLAARGRHPEQHPARRGEHDLR